jgi:hypothetical protein
MDMERLCNTPNELKSVRTIITQAALRMNEQHSKKVQNARESLRMNPDGRRSTIYLERVRNTQNALRMHSEKTKRSRDSQS